MIIRVIYHDGQVGTVLPEELDALIAKRRIYSFKRSDGWVEVSSGPLRGNRAHQHADQGRRARDRDRTGSGADPGS